MPKTPNWPTWLFLFFMTAVIASIVIVRVIYQYAWTITGDSSCIIYKFTPKIDAFAPLRIATEAITKRHFLEKLGPEIGTNLYSRWATPESWFDTKRPRVTTTLEAYPRDESDVRKLEGHLSVCTVEADKTDEWKTVAHDLENALSSLVQYTDAHVQLDPRVFGACASKERPERSDTVCSIKLAIPVAFDVLDTDILDPRAAKTSQQR